ncbi:hypothetical protein [Actinomadura napierensis]|uniref:Integral membrane protein n=1 Tax=Actinomadura napierensis TaxID=267854 RepID=A0ABN2ZP88_9ACTN
MAKETPISAFVTTKESSASPKLIPTATAKAAPVSAEPAAAAAAVGAVLGLITLAGVFRLWRTTRSRGWFWTVIITRAVSALTSVPAFFAGAPAGLQAAVGVGIVLTLTSLWLLATRKTATA